MQDTTVKNETVEQTTTEQPQQQQEQQGQPGEAVNVDLVYSKIKKYVDMRIDDIINRTKEAPAETKQEEPKKAVEW